MTATRKRVFTPPVVIPGILGLLGLLTILAPARSLTQYVLASVLVTGAGALLALAVHEAGHVLAGRLVHFRFARLAAGPVRLDARPYGGLSVGWNDHWRRIGLAVSVPPDTERLRRRQIIFMAGGLLATVTAGVLALIVQDRLGGPVQTWLFEDGTRSLTHLVGVHFLYFFGWFSCFLGLINLLPGEVAGLRTDGGWIAALGRGGPGAEAASATLALTSAILAGARAHPLIPIWIGQMQAVEGVLAREAMLETLAQILEDAPVDLRGK